MDVKEVRGILRVTQQKLADICGVTLRTVQNWEAGRPVPATSQKLMQAILDGREKAEPIPSVTANADANGVSVASVTNSQVNLSKDSDRFFATLEKQQEIMARQLEEISNMRIASQKKDEQIDALIAIIRCSQNK